jgi:hypothetical protein
MAKHKDKTPDQEMMPACGHRQQPIDFGMVA